MTPKEHHPHGAGRTSHVEAANPRSLDLFRPAVSRALEARARVLATASNDRLVTALAACAAEWSNPSFPPRIRATDVLAPILHLDSEMLARGLEWLFASINRSALTEMLGQIEAPAALEHPVERPTGHPARLAGPRIVFHSIAGNVPGLAIPAIIASVLARSVAIVRDSERQPVLTEAFLATLAEHDPDAAAMIVPVTWRSGDVAWESEAFKLAERVELYGSDTNLRDVRARHRHVRAEWVERGTRLSVGFVPSSVHADGASDGFALDVAMYDGLGCLTPHALLVAGRAQATAFAEHLAESLDALETRWPRQRRAFDDEATRRAFIDACEVRRATRAGERLLRGCDDAWVVHQTGPDEPALGPGLRCVRVLGFDSDADALAAIASARTPLAGVGIADTAPDEAYEGLVSRLRLGGATLVCRSGRMQAPPLTWTQDGRHRLGDLLSWQTEAT